MSASQQATSDGCICLSALKPASRELAACSGQRSQPAASQPASQPASQSAPRKDLPHTAEASHQKPHGQLPSQQASLATSRLATLWRQSAAQMACKQINHAGQQPSTQPNTQTGRRRAHTSQNVEKKVEKTLKWTLQSKAENTKTLKWNNSSGRLYVKNTTYPQKTLDTHKNVENTLEIP